MRQQLTQTIALGLKRESVRGALDAVHLALLNPCALGFETIGVFFVNVDGRDFEGDNLLADVFVRAGYVPGGLDGVAGADCGREGEGDGREGEAHFGGWYGFDSLLVGVG